MYDVVIVGAGASGCLCAIRIKQLNPNLKVLILEHNDKIGKKILITGNGKCNLGNTSLDTKNFNTNIKIDNSYLKVLNSIGLVIKEDDKRLYPYSKQSLTVCKCMERSINDLNIDIKYNYEVLEVQKKENIYMINKDIKCKSVVIATGGKSYSNTGSTGIGYDILANLGHHITSLYPSLTYLVTNYKYIKLLDGIRFDCKATSIINGKQFDTEEGQVQFTKNHISGICIFNLSRNIKKYIEEGKKIEISINFIPEYDISKIKDYLNCFQLYKVEDALSGMLNNKLAYVICKDLQIGDKTVKSLTANEFSILINKIINFTFNITTTGNFNESQVTSGGALLDEFTNNLESTINKNLYAIGEVLNVDGKCGGYNLSWAFNSALKVASEITK